MGFPAATEPCPACAEAIPQGSPTCPCCHTPLGGGAGPEVGILCRNCGATAPLDASTCPKCGRALGVPGGLWYLLPVFFLIVIFILGILAAIAVPNFQRARTRAQQRACYANQKCIAGAMEMYNLDKGTNLKTLDPDTLDMLQSMGYLKTQPTCPGFPASKAPYSLNDRNEVECVNHGSVQGSEQPLER